MREEVKRLEIEMFEAQAEMTLRPDPSYRLYWKYFRAKDAFLAACRLWAESERSIPIREPIDRGQ